jgi:hypothetical protein
MNTALQRQRGADQGYIDEKQHNKTVGCIKPALF